MNLSDNIKQTVEHILDWLVWLSVAMPWACFCANLLPIELLRTWGSPIEPHPIVWVLLGVVAFNTATLRAVFDSKDIYSGLAATMSVYVGATVLLLLVSEFATDGKWDLHSMWSPYGGSRPDTVPGLPNLFVLSMCVIHCAVNYLMACNRYYRKFYKWLGLVWLILASCALTSYVWPTPFSYGLAIEGYASPIAYSVATQCLLLSISCTCIYCRRNES